MKKYFIIGVLSGILVSQFLLNSKANNPDPKVYYPQGPERPFRMFEFMIGSGYKRLPILTELENLKDLGTNYLFSLGIKEEHFKNPKDINFNVENFYPFYLRGKYVSLSHDWKVPDNWYDFNQSNVPFVFVGDVTKKFSGDAYKPLFIVRNGYQAYPNYYNAVYEDGHVGKVSYKEAIKLWKKAGVWNLNE